MYTPSSMTMPMGCLEISPVSDQVAASPAVDEAGEREVLGHELLHEAVAELGEVHVGR